MPISMLKAATILSLLFTAVSIWPSISAASDGRTSKLIAEWTARKDFIENCEAHNWSSAACERSKGIQLDAPPNLDRTQNPAPERTSKRKPAPKPKTEGTNSPNGPRTESKETSQKASGVSPGSPILIWYCCQCGGGPMNVATNIHCFCYYQHQRCSYCCVEYSKTRNRMSRNR
ncbi:hypothetical protein PG989_007744 [Apiospora arundinis]